MEDRARVFALVNPYFCWVCKNILLLIWDSAELLFWSFFVGVFLCLQTWWRAGRIHIFLWRCFLCVSEYILFCTWDSVWLLFWSFSCRCGFVFVDMMEGRAGVFGGGHPVIGWHLPRKRSSSLIKSQSGGKVGTKTRLLSVTLRLLSKSRCPGSRLSDNLIRGRWRSWQEWLASVTP